MYVIMEEVMKMDINQFDHLVTIYRVMNQKTFGFRFSAAIVGGRIRLQRLIDSGLIRTEKKVSHRMESCIAMQVMYCVML